MCVCVCCLLLLIYFKCQGIFCTSGIVQHNALVFKARILVDWFMTGFETLQSWCTQALIDGPFVPHIDLWEPCCFTEVPDGPQTYTLNVLWIQKEGAQIRMSEWSQSFTLTKNVGRVFILCSTPPTQWTVWQPH